MAVEFEAVCGPKFMTFWDDVGDPCIVNALDRLSISCFVPKIYGVKIVVKLRSRPKKVVFGPPICRGRGYFRYSTCVFKLHLLSTIWPIFAEFSSATSEIRRQKKKEEETLVKYKSADILCREA